MTLAVRARGAALAGIAGAALAVPAFPSAAAGCSDGSGVTVVVDFGSLGGGQSSGCAAGDPASGIAALRGAGFEPTRAAQEAGYFVCRIDDKPANDPCQRASPADAYWSYWHARAGGSWSFSGTDASVYDPEPGAVEGWAFGAGKPPSSPPPRASSPAPNRTPSAAQPTPASGRSSAAPKQRATHNVFVTPTPGSAPTSAVRTASLRPGQRSSTVAAADRAPPAGPPNVPATSAEASPAAVAEPPAEDRGSRTGPMLAVVVVALIGAAGARQVWLRRHPADGG